MTAMTNRPIETSVPRRDVNRRSFLKASAGTAATSPP